MAKLNKLRVVLDIWPFISHKRIQLLSETLLCKSLGLSQGGSLVSQRCSIHLPFIVTLYTQGAWVGWSESGHNAAKLSVVLGTRYVILWPWCGKFEVITLNATMAWHPAKADTWPFVAQCPGEDHDMTNEWFFRLFTLNEYPCHVWKWSKKNYGREGAKCTCLICRQTDRPDLFGRWQYPRAFTGCQDRIQILLSSQKPADILSDRVNCKWTNECLSRKNAYKMTPHLYKMTYMSVAYK